MTDHTLSQRTPAENAGDARVGRYAIFTRRARGLRKMHAVSVGASQTVCGLPIGVGTGFVRDGDYRGNVPCLSCWTREED